MFDIIKFDQLTLFVQLFLLNCSGIIVLNLFYHYASMRLGKECACRLMKKRLTGFSLFYVAEMRVGHESGGNTTMAALSPGPDVGVCEAAGSGTSSETAVQKCGS